VYKVSLTGQPQRAGGQGLDLAGTINQKTNEADLTLTGDLPADRERTDVLIRTFELPLFKGIEGDIRSDHARLQGPLDDPSRWRLAGQIDLQHFQLIGAHGPLAQDVEITLKLAGRSILLPEFRASGCGGTVRGSGQADIGADWKLAFKGALEAANIDMPKLTATVYGPGNEAQRGTLSLQVNAWDTGKGIQGSGLLGLDKADVLTLSLFAEIFGQMGLGQNEQLRQSDARVVFVFDGPWVTIQQGRLANPLSALDVQKDGTVNLMTHQLDFYVMGVPIKAVEGVLKLPIIGTLSEPFRNLRDKLIRLHVKGNWGDPPNTLVRKEPVTDVTEGTVGFFKDVAKSGGKLGEGAINTFKDIFKSLGGG
jgi:hypothetical protein